MIKQLPKLASLQNCTGCWACFNACSKDAIKMVQEENGFVYPKIDEEKCVGCLACERTCPKNKENENLPTDLTDAFSFSSKDQILNESTSGGAFSVLAEYFLSIGGSVSGVVWDLTDNRELNATREIVSGIGANIKRMKTTKYAPVCEKSTYKTIELLLNSGTFVLFSGCPCEILGLKSFLKKEYKRLYTIALVCQGQGSTAFFKRLISENDQKNGGLVNVNLRSKYNAWDKPAVDCYYSNGLKETAPLSSFPYWYLFTNYKRPCCYSCNLKGENSRADLIIGDFWGIKKIDQKAYNEKGVSFVMPFTEKGNEMLQKLKQSGGRFSSQWDTTRIKIANPAIYRCIQKPDTYSFIGSKIQSNLSNKSIVKQSKRIHFIKRVINKISH
jgi:coenzyme F420-reducing hydrogenase beta subunit